MLHYTMLASFVWLSAHRPLPPMIRTSEISNPKMAHSENIIYLKGRSSLVQGPNCPYGPPDQCPVPRWSWKSGRSRNRVNTKSFSSYRLIMTIIYNCWMETIVTQSAQDHTPWWPVAYLHNMDWRYQQMVSFLWEYCKCRALFAHGKFH